MYKQPLTPSRHVLALLGMLSLLLLGACGPKPAPSGPSVTAREHDLALALYANNGKSAAVSAADPKEAASQVIEESSKGASRCIARSIEMGEVKRATRLEVALEITRGKATRVDISRVKAGSYLERCLKSHFSRLPFPRFGQPVALRLPLVVTPSL